MKEELLIKLEEIFPSSNIVFEGEGWGSTAFAIDDKIIRVPRGENSYDGYKKEEELLKFLKNKISFEIPEIKIEYEPFFYSTHKKIEGLKWDITSFNLLNEREKDLFCEDIALFFAEIHSIDLNELQKEGNLKNYSKKNENFSYREVEESLKNNFTEIEIQKFYELYLKIKKTNDYALIHCDFYGGNSLIDENHRLKGVFDFGNSTVDDRTLDFLSLFYEDYFDLLDKVIKSYEINTNSRIDKNKIKSLKEFNVVGSLVYLAKNPLLKETKKEEWEEGIASIKNIIKQN